MKKIKVVKISTCMAIMLGLLGGLVTTGAQAFMQENFSNNMTGPESPAWRPDTATGLARANSIFFAKQRLGENNGDNVVVVEGGDTNFFGPVKQTNISKTSQDQHQNIYVKNSKVGGNVGNAIKDSSQLAGSHQGNKSLQANF